MRQLELSNLADRPSYLREFELPPGRDWSQYRVRAKDGMPQALIPAGEFQMGGPDGVEMFGPCDPARPVYISAFWIDMHPVTVAQYQRFSQATGRKTPEQPNYSEPEHPVVKVTWEDATAYATFVDARLPSEAEYEKAARAGTSTRYSWGNDWSPDMANGCCVRATRKPNIKVGTSRVCSYPPNGFGLYDMVANVKEWCRDRSPGSVGSWQKVALTTKQTLYKDPVHIWEQLNPTDSSDWYRVVRGGSWKETIASEFRLGHSSVCGRTNEADFIGFRCAQQTLSLWGKFLGNRA